MHRLDETRSYLYICDRFSVESIPRRNGLFPNNYYGIGFLLQFYVWIVTRNELIAFSSVHHCTLWWYVVGFGNINQAFELIHLMDWNACAFPQWNAIPIWSNNQFIVAIVSGNVDYFRIWISWNLLWFHWSQMNKFCQLMKTFSLKRILF